jgi:hypothetical protein
LRSSKIDLKLIATLTTIHRTVIMTAITADMFARTPPFARAHEALSSIMALHGRARMAAWARAADDDATRIVAVMLENTKLAVNLLRDLDEALRSRNDRKLAKVRRRLDRVLATLAANGEARTSG